MVRETTGQILSRFRADSPVETILTVARCVSVNLQVWRQPSLFMGGKATIVRMDEYPKSGLLECISPNASILNIEDYELLSKDQL